LRTTLRKCKQTIIKTPFATAEDAAKIYGVPLSRVQALRKLLRNLTKGNKVREHKQRQFNLECPIPEWGISEEMSRACPLVPEPILFRRIDTDWWAKMLANKIDKNVLKEVRRLVRKAKRKPNEQVF
jgi:hypothetical protein